MTLTRHVSVTLVCVATAVGLILLAAFDQKHSYGEAPPTANTAPQAFKICNGQTYALCAVASCFVFDQVAYCKCDVKFGNSISAPFSFDNGEDVCTVNGKGADNGYMVSTFSLPDEVVSGGPLALYTCPARTSDGAYAQCEQDYEEKYGAPALLIHRQPRQSFSCPPQRCGSALEQSGDPRQCGRHTLPRAPSRAASAAANSSGVGRWPSATTLTE